MKYLANLWAICAKNVLLGAMAATTTTTAIATTVTIIHRPKCSKMIRNIHMYDMCVLLNVVLIWRLLFLQSIQKETFDLCTTRRLINLWKICINKYGCHYTKPLPNRIVSYLRKMWVEDVSVSWLNFICYCLENWHCHSAQSVSTMVCVFLSWERVLKA